MRVMSARPACGLGMGRGVPATLGAAGEQRGHPERLGTFQQAGRTGDLCSGAGEMGLVL